MRSRAPPELPEVAKESSAEPTLFCRGSRTTRVSTTGRGWRASDRGGPACTPRRLNSNRCTASVDSATSHGDEGLIWLNQECVYYVCMARMNIYLPDDLAAKARAAGLNLSALTRAAVEAELARALTDRWLERVLALAPTLVSHDEAIEALDAAREDFGARG